MQKVKPCKGDGWGRRDCAPEPGLAATNTDNSFSAFPPHPAVAPRRRAGQAQLMVAQQGFGRVRVLLMLAVTALTAVNTFNGGWPPR